MHNLLFITPKTATSDIVEDVALADTSAAGRDGLDAQSNMWSFDCRVRVEPKQRAVWRSASNAQQLCYACGPLKKVKEY
jgi:hypothetical protein